jgi:hypothetical protein
MIKEIRPGVYTDPEIKSCFKETKPKVTFMIPDYIVPVMIKGEPRGAFISREDNGLVVKFFDFCIKNHIYSDSMYGGFSGAGKYLGFFYKEHIPAIKKFLEENGGTEEKNPGSYRLY